MDLTLSGSDGLMHIHRYGQHLSKEEVGALVAPHPDSVDLVDAWLRAHDLDIAASERSHAGDWITIRVSVAQAEKMLGTKYNVFRHGKSDEYVIRTMNYSLPNALHEHVALVAPTTYFGTMKSMKATSFVDENGPTVQSDPTVAQLTGPNSLATVPSSCARTITPSCLRALYNVGNYVPRATKVNRLGVAGYLDEFANRADLQVCTVHHPAAHLNGQTVMLTTCGPHRLVTFIRYSSRASALTPSIPRTRPFWSTMVGMTSPNLVLRCVAFGRVL